MIVPIPTMLSFTLRRVLSHPGVFSTVQMLPTRVIPSNQSLVQRNFVTTVNDQKFQNLDSTANSEPEPKSKSKSTRRNTGSSTKTAGSDKTKVKIRDEDKPPKQPVNAYVLWISDWIRSQPKIENLEVAQDTVKKGAQIWHTVPEHEKQRYQEKCDALRVEYYRRIEEWREKVDPSVLRELNRRRVAKGQKPIRGGSEDDSRPLTGYLRYYMHVRDEYPRTEEDYPAYFKALSTRVSSQWKAMSDAEKAKYTDPARADFAAWREKHGAESQAKA
ncbi:hypothetical protein DFH94DRAFT_721614 [Russula ochroleuca]|uniref:HMG box domain-containing protein n=1 Tax=Russula ochroleuca TaxID=152965 RepID=A0A9P5TBV0_9AGAM|nr:hypothetical protein DFH94DRAFT_721614 [Russula ochroleuca]